MQADVRLRENKAHGEGEQVRRAFGIRQTDNAATIEFGVLIVVPAVGDNAIA
jgi:hypothetical protein